MPGTPALYLSQDPEAAIPVGLVAGERHLLDLPLSHADGRQVAADPAGAAAAARRHVEAAASAIVVHFDVDAVDSADLPLANYPHHGKGLTFDAAMTVLRELCASPAFACLVLTEVNPTHDPGGELLNRYADGVAGAVGGYRKRDHRPARQGRHYGYRQAPRPRPCIGDPARTYPPPPRRARPEVIRQDAFTAKP